MKVKHASLMVTLEENIVIGELKAKLIAQVIGDKECFDVDFADVDEISYMGISIESHLDWKKFKTFHKEMGIDFDSHMSKKFNEIFTKEAVRKILDKIKFN